MKDAMVRRNEINSDSNSPGSNPGIEIWICNSLIISFVNWAGAVFEDLSLPSRQRQATPASSSKKTVTEESSKKNQYGVVLTQKKKKIKIKKIELSGSPIGPPIQLVQFLFNHFLGQLTGLDRNHDQPSVRLVRFLKSWFLFFMIFFICFRLTW